MSDDLLIKTLVVILASVCAISLVARLRFPAAGGYLLAGLVIGPHGLQLIAASDESKVCGRARHHFSNVHGGP
jgi:CPA2 family monovalent cation:H+ antiporter-2